MSPTTGHTPSKSSPRPLPAQQAGVGQAVLDLPSALGKLVYFRERARPPAAVRVQSDAMIWLLRHGEAADGSPDAERPLTEKGKAQSRAAGEALKALGVEVDACLSSPKIRAVDTAKLACEVLGVDVQLEPKLAGGPFHPDELAAGLGDDVLLVGHDPDFSMAVHSMTGAQIRMKKGGIAGIDRGELKVLLRPAELEAIAR